MALVNASRTALDGLEGPVGLPGLCSLRQGLRAAL